VRGTRGSLSEATSQPFQKKNHRLWRYVNAASLSINILNISQILPTSIKKRSQVDKNTALEQFRCQIAPSSAPGRSPSYAGLDIWCLLADNVAPMIDFRIYRPKMTFPGLIFETLENRKSLQNLTFVYRRALGPSKNGLQYAARKKHEKIMKT